MPLDPSLRALLVCPACHGELKDEGAALKCPACGKSYPVVDGIPYLVVNS